MMGENVRNLEFISKFFDKSVNSWTENKLFDSISKKSNNISLDKENKSDKLANIYKNYFSSQIRKNSKINHIKRIDISSYIDYSYNKKTYGSIPGKSEIFLLDKNQIKKHNQRFFGSNSIFSKEKEITPGVGEYNLRENPNKVNNLIILSTSLRKDNEKRLFNNIEYSPGVGDYSIERGRLIENQRNNLRYKKLYPPFRPSSINNIIENKKKNDVLSSLVYYLPKNLDEITKNKKKYNFSSYSSRSKYRGFKVPFLIDPKNHSPGPGQYFKEQVVKAEGNVLSNNYLKKEQYNLNKNGKLNSIQLTKSVNYFPNFFEENESSSIKNNGNRINFRKKNKVYTFENIYNLYRERHNKYSIEEKLEEELKKINNNIPANKKYKFYLKQEKELRKIKSIIGDNNGKPDYYSLIHSRWENKKYEFKVPGPAYYFQ